VNNLSLSASFDFTLVSNQVEVISAVDIIQRMLKFGWTLNDGGVVSYLPLGDQDDYDWQRVRITIDELLPMLREKEQKNEVIGVGMTWKDTDIGGEFLFRGSGEISISLSINRKTLRDTMGGVVMDLSWYLTKLLPILSQGDLIVESFSYQEHV